MPEQAGILSYVPTRKGRKGPSTYKAAKGNVGKGGYGNLAGKPATKRKLSMVDKKVKQVSNKIVRYHSKTPGPAAHNRY